MIEEEKTHKDISVKKELLSHVYITDILMINSTYKQVFEQMIDHVMFSFEDLLLAWIHLDENQDMFEIGLSNWIQFIDEKHSRELLQEIQ
jgi:hypothetical protein